MASQGSAMDAYPQVYLTHNLPFLLLSGLPLKDQTPGPQGPQLDTGLAIPTPYKVTSELAPLTSDTACQIRDAFLEAAAGAESWDGRAHRDRAGSLGYVMKHIGRVSGRHQVAIALGYRSLTQTTRTMTFPCEKPSHLLCLPNRHLPCGALAQSQLWPSTLPFLLSRQGLRLSLTVS